MSNKKLPTIKQCREVAQSRLFTIEALTLQFSNQEERVYERLKRRHSDEPRAVLMIAMADETHFYLVREYAVGLHDYALWLPKGLREAHEDTLTAANRELQEEIGFAAKDLQQLTTLTTVPGYWGAKINVVLARDLYPSKLPGDEPEPIEVIPWSMDNLDALLMREDFSEARSIAALFIAKRWLETQD